jgi:hypothetical protein
MEDDYLHIYDFMGDNGDATREIGLVNKSMFHFNEISIKNCVAKMKFFGRFDLFF